MAARALRRGAAGRFVSDGEALRLLRIAHNREVRAERAAQAALAAARPDPRKFPTQEAPRWRLVVFDKRWPWRASRSEVLKDALASRNAHRDAVERVIYLAGYAFVQRDPPSPGWRNRCVG